jgi:hypothetical protein
MVTTYTTEGSVCGGCGHNHRTIGAAQQCADRHHAAIVRRNGSNAYSDREVVRTDGLPLDEWERDELFYAQGYD